MEFPRTALVTGASRRIGRGIAERLAQEGYALVLHTSERSSGEAEALASRLRAAGTPAQVVIADLADFDATASLVARAAAAIGRIGLLVNNASLFEGDTTQDFTAASFDTQMAVNLRAPCQLVQAFAAQPGEPCGAVVNIIDERVWRLNPTNFSYTLSKSALWTATQTMAQALAPHIRVNAVGPGPTIRNVRQSEAEFGHEVASVPLGRAVEVGEIAGAVVYLASARAVTGQMIAVDSGQHLAWRTPDVTGAGTGT